VSGAEQLSTFGPAVPADGSRVEHGYGGQDVIPTEKAAIVKERIAGMDSYLEDFLMSDFIDL